MSKLNIRTGIFETNSSSVHTLSINNTNSTNLDIPSEFTFSFDGEFGWGHDTYIGSYDTASYFYQVLKNAAYKEGLINFISSDEYNNNMEKYNENKYWMYSPEKYPELQKYITESENNYKQIVEEILSEYGCHTVIWAGETKDAYIDHVDQTIGFFNDMINDPNLLIHFLFGDSVIETGNDNDEYYVYTESSVINKNNYYEYVKGN